MKNLSGFERAKEKDDFKELTRKMGELITLMQSRALSSEGRVPDMDD